MNQISVLVITSLLILTSCSENPNGIYQVSHKISINSESAESGRQKEDPDSVLISGTDVGRTEPVTLESPEMNLTCFWEGPTKTDTGDLSGTCRVQMPDGENPPDEIHWMAETSKRSEGYQTSSLNEQNHFSIRISKDSLGPDGLFRIRSETIIGGGPATDLYFSYDHTYQRVRNSDWTAFSRVLAGESPYPDTKPEILVSSNQPMAPDSVSSEAEKPTETKQEEPENSSLVPPESELEDSASPPPPSPVLSENFDMGLSSGGWFSSFGSKEFISFASQRFDCRVPPGTLSYDGIESSSVYNFQNHFIQVDLTSAVSFEPGSQPGIFSLNFGSGRELQFLLEAGLLIARNYRDFIATNLYYQMYTGQTLQLRIAHKQSEGHFEFAIKRPSEELWRVVATNAPDWPLDRVKPELKCGAWLFGSPPTRASFDNITSDLKAEDITPNGTTL